MAGYTRQSIAEIAANEEVKAEPLNAEFNALATAFNSSTGHAHDGTSGSGPKINLTVSVVGNLPATNLANDSIPYIKLENIADNKVLGNVSGSEASISPVDILDEDTMVSNRDDALPTQQSVKAYVDALDAAVVDALDTVVEDLTTYIDDEISDLEDVIESGLNNRVCFRAHKNGSNQSVVVGNAKITYGTEEFDIGSYYDALNSRWTPPAGRYHIFAAYTNSGTGGVAMTIELRKNNVSIARGHASTSGTGILCQPIVSTIVEANGTDYFEIFAVQVSGTFSGNILGTITDTYFYGEVV